MRHVILTIVLIAGGMGNVSFLPAQHAHEEYPSIVVLDICNAGSSAVMARNELPSISETPYLSLAPEFRARTIDAAAEYYGYIPVSRIEDPPTS